MLRRYDMSIILYIPWKSVRRATSTQSLNQNRRKPYIFQKKPYHRETARCVVSCQLPRNSAETTYTTSPEQIWCPTNSVNALKAEWLYRCIVFSSLTCWHDGVGTSGSEATSDVGEILNVAVCKDGDLDIVTVNSQRNSTITQHSASDYQLIQRICLCRSVIYTHWMTELWFYVPLDTK